MARLVDRDLYNQIAEARRPYSSGGALDDHPESWWYISGYADARSGYGDAAKGKGTVCYEVASSTEKEAYDLGFIDGDTVI